MPDFKYQQRSHFHGYIFILLLLTCFFKVNAQGNADSLLDFIKKNQAKSSLVLQKNNTVIARLNENKLMPLASTVKIIVAIEFAKQAAKNLINQDATVALSELDKYYLPNTDGDAHPNWIKYEKSLEHINNDSIKLIDVARGMIMFSSNANTEYLMGLLGLKNVNSNIQMFGLN
jgi:D-alanyl-D-alanine carboxypeptidase